MSILIASSKKWFSECEKNKDFLQLECEWVSNPEELKGKLLNGLTPRIIFFPHWNWKVSKEIYEKYTCVGFHVSPLPFGRGGTPIQNLILRGFDKAPVNALAMGPELDAGDILLQDEISLEGKLSEIFLRIGNVIQRQIVQIARGEFSPTPQSGDVTVFRRLTEEDNQIFLEDMTLSQIYDRIRMLDASEYPRSFLKIADFKIELSDACLSGNQLEARIKIMEIPDQLDQLDTGHS